MSGVQQPGEGCSDARDETDGTGLSAEVSQERLSFLLELVVQKRLSAQDAQQIVICMLNTSSDRQSQNFLWFFVDDVSCSTLIHI